MKHLPNLLTLANLFCGCIAITFILSAQNFSTAIPSGAYLEVSGIEQPYWGSVFIILAAVFDMMDGWAARALNIFSPIGKDLDSLADLVSFGLAPSMILFKMLWTAYMFQPEALEVSMLVMSPAFLIACFAALRLARFNISSQPKADYFIGLPTPAVGLFVALFPLMSWFGPGILTPYFYVPAALYGIIGLLCYLMVSRLRFFKLIPGSWTKEALIPRVILVAGILAAVPFLKWEAAFVALALYILTALISPVKQS
jgi:CDP-diacylglycerol---serine O-phosphatidyltransferase